MKLTIWLEYLILQLVSSSPHDQEQGVSISNVIALTFSTAVHGVSNETIKLHQGSPSGTPVKDIVITTDDNIRFNLQIPLLEPRADYYVSFDSSQIRSLDTDDYLIKSPALHFTTGSAKNPTVWMSSPADEAKGVSTTAKITLDFFHNLRLSS